MKKNIKSTTNTTILYNSVR